MAKIKCLSCGEILESKFRHDFQMCSCENESFVAGGSDYTRIGGQDIKLIKFLDTNEEGEIA